MSSSVKELYNKVSYSLSAYLTDTLNDMSVDKTEDKYIKLYKLGYYAFSNLLKFEEYISLMSVIEELLNSCYFVDTVEKRDNEFFIRFDQSSVKEYIPADIQLISATFGLKLWVVTEAYKSKDDVQTIVHHTGFDKELALRIFEVQTSVNPLFKDRGAYDQKDCGDYLKATSFPDENGDYCTIELICNRITPRLEDFILD